MSCNCKELASYPVDEDFVLRYGQIFQGESAYSLAQKGGYTGTEAQFINLLGQVAKIGTVLAATPSGHPMHDAFVSVGASWNANTGHWKLYDVEDLTNADMIKILELGTNRFYKGAILANTVTSQRVVYPKAWLANSPVDAVNMSNFAASATKVEWIGLTVTDEYVSDTNPLAYDVYASSLFYAFAYCSKLRKIRSILNLRNCTNVGYAFYQCNALENVRLRELNISISFANSPNLTKESIIFMIEKSTATSNIIITLHATAYAMAMADHDIQTALESKTFVTLASA